MRKVIISMVMSLDGFICGPDGELDWEVRDPETNAFVVAELLQTVDTMLLGRVLFEGFQMAWPAMGADPKSPKELVEFAHWIEDSPKIVFSKTLDKVGWKNTTLVEVKNNDDIVNVVKKLKNEQGGDMVVFGGARFAQTLVELGLVDEYRLKLQPIVLGKGLALFKDVKNRRNLKLIKSQAFKSGVVALYYQSAK